MNVNLKTLSRKSRKYLNVRSDLFFQYGIKSRPYV